MWADKEVEMKVARFSLPLFAIVVLFCTSDIKKMANLSSTNAIPPAKSEAERLPPGQHNPIGWAPFQDSFVGTEGQAFLIGVTADCPSRNPTGQEVQLLPPTPSFV